ncbi:MAG TPA: alpha/beta hydrolase [Burkholderiales bacterium]|nr:alpha/beta hydrolase [Burkholderiales bacterium]
MNHNDPRDGLSRRDFVRVLTAGAVVMGAAALGSAGVARAADGAQPIEFMSKGLRCRGLKYVPAGLKSGEKRPCIVLAHGFSAVKEMYFTDYAEAFSKAGYVAVVFDYRYQGESEGEPRGQIFPWEQIEDFRNAITFAQMQPEVDPEKIGVFGSSYSGGHVICVGALDRRVKCVAGQVPLIDGWANFQAIVPRAAGAGMLKYLESDRIERYKTGKVNYLPVVAPDNNAVLNTSDSYKWFTETHQKKAPRWENRVTVESIEKFIEYSPAVFLPRLSPTPFLMMVAENDILTPTDVAVAGFELAREPKKLVILPGGHFDAYVNGFPISSGNAIEWYKRWLG